MMNRVSQKIDSSPSSNYINTQNFNGITRFLHSIRYAHVQHFLQTVQSLSCLQSKNEAKLSLLEIGCGYGKSLEVIKQNANLSIKHYLGIDIESDFIHHCQKLHPNHANRFATQPEKIEFIHADIREYASSKRKLDFHPNAIVALECFEHMNEYDLPMIIDWLSSLRSPLFISVPNEIGPALLLKNVGSWLMGYTRFKEYSFRDTLNATLYRLEKLPKHETGHIGFDWRWLLSVLKQRFKVTHIGTSPVGFIPRFLSPSIYFYCEP